MSEIAPMSLSPLPKGALPELSKADRALWDVAQKLEASFLAEMLKSAGVGEARESFGDGAGEEQFASFLRHEQASLMVKSGGIGLAQSLFEALRADSDASV